MELAYVLVAVDDVLVQDFAVGAHKVGTVCAAVDFPLRGGVFRPLVAFELLLAVGLEGAALAAVFALAEVLGLAVKRQLEAVARRVAAIVAFEGLEPGFGRKN